MLSHRTVFVGLIASLTLQFTIIDSKSDVSQDVWDLPWPEEIHEFSFHFNLSDLPEETIQGLLTMKRFVVNGDYMTNVTGFPNGGWVAFPNINLTHIDKYLEEMGQEKISFCAPVIYNVKGQESFIGCQFYTRKIVRSSAKYIYRTLKQEVDPAVAAATILTILGIFGNSLIIAVMCLYKNMRNPTNFLLGSLAVNDLMVTAVIPYLSVYNRFFAKIWSPSTIGCNFIDFIERVWFVNSVFHLTAISFERFFAICMAMKVKTICTMRRAKILGPSLWVFSMIVSIPTLFTMNFTASGCRLELQYYQDWFVYHKVWELVLFYGIPLLLILHNYIRIIITLIKSLRANAALMEGSSQGTSGADNEDIKKRLKVVKMLVTIVVIFILCWTPRVVWELVYGLHTRDIFYNTFDARHGTQFVGILKFYLIYWSIVNSVANAPTYFLTSNQFNKAFKRALTCGRYGKEERVTSMITQSSLASTSFTEKEKPSVKS